MSFFKKILLVVAAFFIVACDNSVKNVNNNNAKTSETVAAKKIRVGVIAGPELEIAQIAAQNAKTMFNLDVDLVVFNDYVVPNEALDSGDIDLNAFQHIPFLSKQVLERGYKISYVANTFVYPIAAYSKKIKHIDELQDGATIVIPNDPTNLGRSLILLDKQGLITLADNTYLNSTILDIVKNPKNLNIIEIEAPMIPLSLDDEQVSLAIINTAFSVPAGLIPTRDGLFAEDKDSPYVNVIATKISNIDAEFVKQYVQAFQTPEVESKALEVFQGGAIKGW